MAGSQLAGVVLCGGRSSRMGSPKAWLPFGDERMLQRVVRILGDIAEPMVVVAAPGQELPELPESVLRVADSEEGQGPLEGIRRGLAALPADCRAAYVTSCDVPLLKIGFVQYLAARLENYDIVVPREEKFYHPLAAIYRPQVADVAARLLTENQRRPAMLFSQCRTREVPVDQLRAVDPQLETLHNLNYPEDYERALKSL